MLQFLQRKTVFCKLRVPLQRLLKEVDRIDYLLKADSKELKLLVEQGRSDYWKGLKIPEKTFETKISPFKFIYFQYNWEDPAVAEEELQKDGHYSDATLWRQTKEKIYKRYPTYCHSDAVLSLGQNVTDADESILRGIDRLKLIRAIIESKETGGCHLNIDFLLNFKCILGFFPTADFVELKLLEQNWFKILDWPWNSRVDEIKDYFGEQIGLYFQWLTFYTNWLFWAGLVGFCFWVWIAAANSDMSNATGVPYFAGKHF